MSYVTVRDHTLQDGEVGGEDNEVSLRPVGYSTSVSGSAPPAIYSPFLLSVHVSNPSKMFEASIWQ